LAQINKKNIFLHSLSSFDTNEEVNIILSPELYWVRVFNLPLESSKQVLNVIPSLFEEFIDIANKIFYVKKLSKNRYIAFAYDESTLISTIQNAGLSFENINKIYFSQIEFLDVINSMDTPYIKIDDCLFSLVDDVLVKIPKNIKISRFNNIDIQAVKLSKDSISINATSKYINNKTAIFFSIILATLSFFFLIKTFVHYHIVEEYETKTSQIKNTGNSSLSSLQLKSIIKRYDRTFLEQVKIRGLFEYVLDIKKYFMVQIISISYENKTLQLRLSNNSSDKGLGNKIQKFIDKKYDKSTIKSYEKYFLVEIKL